MSSAVFRICQVGICLLLVSCSPYSARSFVGPSVLVPESYSASKDEGVRVEGHWWKQFESSELNQLISQAFLGNLGLKASWARLRQAEALRTSSRSAALPQLDLTGNAQKTTQAFAAGPSVGFPPSENSLLVSSGLSLEIDLWRRIASESSAASFRLGASEEDLVGTALILSSRVAEVYFELVELQKTLGVLDGQIKSNRQLFELIELRFANGRSTALDVFRQKAELQAILAERPVAKARLAAVQAELAVLLGEPSAKFADANVFPDLPSLPETGAPADLLFSRPDMRAGLKRVQASEYDLAAAIADRFPRLQIGLNYSFQASSVTRLFERELGSLSSGLSIPLIDGRRREAEVSRRRARVDELLAEFSESYLRALQEVEVSLQDEKHRRDLLRHLDGQVSALEAAFNQAKSRYLNGQVSYLDVITSLNTLQRVQRRQIAENRSLLVSRVRLYVALGGYWEEVEV